jgi:glutathione S-transferase
MKKPILWSYPDSTYNWKVCLALFELGYDFDFRVVNVFDKNVPLPADFLKISPFGAIPILQDGDHVIQESSVIVEYADLKSGGSRLFPADPMQALGVRYWDRFTDTRLIPQCGKIFFNIIKPEDQQDKAAIDSGRKEAARYANHVEAALGTSRWIFGQNISFADLSLAIALCQYPHYGISFLSFPNLRRWLDQVRDRESWQKLHEQYKPYIALAPGAIDYMARPSDW